MSCFLQMFVRFIHAAVIVIFIAVYSFIIRTYHNLFSHSNTDGHLGCFPFGAS